jgi:hypothetical protein
VMSVDVSLRSEKRISVQSTVQFLTILVVLITEICY